MNKNHQTLKQLLIISTFSLSLYTLYAWTTPTATFPNGNVAAPLNIGSQAQVKSGGLTLGGTLKIGTNPMATPCNSLNNGEIRYDTVTNKIQYCKLNKWENLAIEGGVTQTTSAAPIQQFAQIQEPVGTIKRYTLSSSPVAIASDGVNAWVISEKSSDITKIDPSGIITIYKGQAKYPSDIAFDGVNMWILNYSHDSVTKISPAGIMTTYPMGPPLVAPQDQMSAMFFLESGNYGIAFDGVNIWVSNIYGSLRRVSLDGRVLDTFNFNQGMSKGPIVNLGSSVIYELVVPGGNLFKVDRQGIISTYFLNTTAAASITSDGSNIWTANWYDNSVTKIRVK